MKLENTFPPKLQQSFPKLSIRSYLKSIIPSFIFSYPSQWHIKINKIELRLQLGGLGRIYNFIQGFWGDFPGLRAQPGMDFMDISTGGGWLRWRHHNSPDFHGQISPKIQNLTPKRGQFKSKDSPPDSCWEVGLYPFNNPSTFCFFRIKFNLQTFQCHNTNPQNTEQWKYKISPKFPGIYLVLSAQDIAVEFCKETEHLLRNPIFIKEKGIYKTKQSRNFVASWTIWKICSSAILKQAQFKTNKFCNSSELRTSQNN